MKKVFVLPYSATLDNSDFQTGILKGVSIVYNKRYYPFNQVGDIFTFQHGFFSENKKELVDKRNELQAKNNEAVISDRKAKANKLIFDIEDSINGLIADSKTRMELIDTLIRCKNYIAFTNNETNICR